MEVHIVADAVSSRRYLHILLCVCVCVCVCVCARAKTVYVCYYFCISLHSQTDRLFALSRLKQSGAYLTTTEGVLLQLVQDAKHPNFKEVLTAAALWIGLDFMGVEETSPLKCLKKHESCRGLFFSFTNY